MEYKNEITPVATKSNEREATSPTLTIRQKLTNIAERSTFHGIPNLITTNKIFIRSYSFFKNIIQFKINF